MLSLALVAGFIASALAEKLNFSPQKPDLDFHEERIWVHLNPKCFADEAAVRSFKDHLVKSYSCISFNERRKQIYKHPLSSNYSVWSLWLEADEVLDCLSTHIELPEAVAATCVDNVFFEPIQYVTTIPEACGAQGAKDVTDLWSLDILDGTADDIYIHPLWTTSNSENVQADDSVEAIILDTAVDATHIEFGGLDIVNLFSGNMNPSTSYEHGTHVAGTVVGHTVGGAKNTNFAWYPVCQLGGSCAWSDIEGGYNTAIDYMREDASKRYVINYSVGGGRSALNDAAYIAWGERINAAGGIWVTSAGNSGADACNFSPAFTSEALTVGAYDVYHASAWFSNYGSCVDVWGPGVAVYSAAVGGGYVAFSGTSMSSPNIASVVVNLLKEDSSYSLDGIKIYMEQNARTVNNNGREGAMNQAYITCSLS